MADQELRDRRGRLLGKIRLSSTGRYEGRDVGGRIRGTYDPRTDETRDASGRVVGRGNMLPELVIDPTR